MSTKAVLLEWSTYNKFVKSASSLIHVLCFDKQQPYYQLFATSK